MKEDDEIQKVFSKYLNGHCSSEEEAYLFEYLSFTENEGLAKFLILSELENDDDLPAESSESMRTKLDNLLQQIMKNKKKFE